MLTTDLIAKTRAQIQQLYQQTRQIDETNRLIKAARFKYRDHFNVGLFHCTSVALYDYVIELEDNFNTLLRLNQQGEHQLNPRGELLTQQLTALIQAVRANEIARKEHRFQTASNKQRFANYTPANKNKNKQYYPSPAGQQAASHIMTNSHQIHQELAQHHEYERRLNEMVYERQAKMNDAKGTIAQQLQNEILALHQRLGKCRRAISVIEERIQFAESGNGTERR